MAIATPSSIAHRVTFRLGACEVPIEVSEMIEAALPVAGRAA